MTETKLRINVLLLALVLLSPLLLACSSSSSSPTEPSGSVSIAQVEARSATLVNDARRGNGVSPDLVLDAILSDVARTHSEAMRDGNFFGHVDLAGNSVDGRLRIAGVTFSGAGENLARVENASDPAAFAHDLLMGNTVHRDNILRPQFSLIGVGVARSGSTYWITQVFLRL